MLLVIQPLTNIFSAIWPFKDAIPLFLVVHVVAPVLPAIVPRKVPIAMLLILEKVAPINTTIGILKHPLPMHLVLQPLTTVLPPLRLPMVLATPLHLVVHEVPLVRRAIRPPEIAHPRLLSILEFTRELSAIGEYFFTLTMLVSILKSAAVTNTIDASVQALSLQFSILPFTLLYAAIGIDHSTPSIGVVVTPKALKCALVRPRHRPLPMLAPTVLVHLPVVYLALLVDDLFEDEILFLG